MVLHLVSILYFNNPYSQCFQTPDMQWSYTIRGILPDYSPPRGVSSHPMRGPHPDPRKRGDRVNYILDNIRLKTTAISSPIKGAAVIQRLKMS